MLIAGRGSWYNFKIPPRLPLPNGWQWPVLARAQPAISA
jgi:hypothetical protein